MTLLRLNPDSERLRRIAKAHAAGELSTPDYRRIRADVIDSFAGAPPEATGDETEPRWLYRPIAPAIRTDPPLSRRKPGGPSPLWTWLLAVVVLVLVIFVAVAAARGSALTPRAQRDPRPSAVVPSTAVAQLTRSLQTTL
jgi:hypothetical protein